MFIHSLNLLPLGGSFGGGRGFGGRGAGGGRGGSFGGRGPQDFGPPEFVIIISYLQF